MAGDTTSYTYRIFRQNQEPVIYHVSLNHLNGYEYPIPQSENVPEWLRLDYSQCPHCPLSRDQYAICPVARNIYPVVEDWKSEVSHTPVYVEVENDHRQVSSNTTLQKALCSLMGLMIGSSQCPHTQFFRPMAYFHLPFSTAEETFFRSITSYFTLQSLLASEHQRTTHGLEDLKRMYENIHILNKSLTQRLLKAAGEDASLNAVILLDIFSACLPLELDKHLNNLKQLYDTLLRQGYITPDHVTDTVSVTENN